jgi:hypothetical protein
MDKFQPHIIPVYPADNHLIFEEWFAENYKGCNTDRGLLPVFFTSFYVNNNYGNDLAARKELQEYIYSLDRNKKWFVPIQYDDSILDDVSHLDLLRFEMSKSTGVGLPLLCQPHPYKFHSEKKWFASFIGSRTHPVRDKLEQYKDKDGYYISFEPHDIETYCRILHESVFSLSPRGYGANSFRASEAMQYGAIPAIISDDFIHPFNLKLQDYGITLHSKHVDFLDETLRMVDTLEIIRKQELCRSVYKDVYTFEGCMNKIIETLENEYNHRESFRTFAQANERNFWTRDNQL